MWAIAIIIVIIIIVIWMARKKSAAAEHATASQQGKTRKREHYAGGNAYDQLHSGTSSNTLSRRHGMRDAGEYAEEFSTQSCVGTFDCLKQNFSSIPDVGRGTMWTGYQYRSVLPG